MQFRWPDDPLRVGPAELIRIDRTEPVQWFGTFKWDGWRRPIYIDNGTIQLFSKHDWQAKKIPPRALMDELRSMGFPDGKAIDAEWMGPRCAEVMGGRHWFVLFDL